MGVRPTLFRAFSIGPVQEEYGLTFAANLADAIMPEFAGESELHWALTSSTEVPEGQNYVDLTFRLDWASTPREPISAAGLVLNYPYRALTMIPRTAVTPSEVPGFIDVVPSSNFAPVPQVPDGHSVQAVFLMGMTPVFPVNAEGYSGEVELSFRLLIDADQLQNPGDTLDITVARVCMIAAPRNEVSITLTRAGEVEDAVVEEETTEGDTEKDGEQTPEEDTTKDSNYSTEEDAPKDGEYPSEDEEEAEEPEETETTGTSSQPSTVATGEQEESIPNGAESAAIASHDTEILPITGDLMPEQFRERFMYGDENGNFRPHEGMTRAEAAALLVRLMLTDSESAAGNAGADVSERFSDVSQGAWYFDYIAAGYANDLIRGFPDGTFRPNQQITREEFAAIVSRVTVTLPAGALANAEDVSEWSKGYVYTVLSFGWLDRAPNGAIRPLEDITRAEATAMLSRALERDKTTATSIAGVPEVLIFPDASDASTWYYFYVIGATNCHWFITDGSEEIWTRVDN